MTENTTELSALAGAHKLTGVSRSQEPFRSWLNRDAMRETLSFTLDSITYTAVEDPDDGYRSMMSEVRVSPGVTLDNTFAPVDVIAEHVEARNSGVWSETCDILVIKHAASGAMILTVGTENTNDYYPYFVCEFDATALGEVSS